MQDPPSAKMSGLKQKMYKFASFPKSKIFIIFYLLFIIFRPSTSNVSHSVLSEDMRKVMMVLIPVFLKCHEQF